MLATVATAFLMVGVTDMSWQWSLPAALVFGALISATDPVAVVAVLREVGAPKSLAVLIEGESLMNDGTAIVVFTVLLGLLTAASGDGGASFEIGPTALRFLWVVTGGVGVGLVLSLIATSWIARTYNDPMVEITVTLALAYASMILAEGVLHVSGVLAVVTSGLWMKGPGRTRISPEVHHFLEHFWELLAYAANTIIFYLVGLVIAANLDQATMDTLLVIGLAYLGIMVIRFAVTFLAMPVIALVSEPLSRAQATVMSWGGLRGAVSLALALIVSQTEGIDPALQQQILAVTTGVVLLTILVNGSTTGRLLGVFGFNKMPLPERLALLRAERTVLDGVAARIEEVAATPELRTVQWADARSALEQRFSDLESRRGDAQKEFEASTEIARADGLWRRALAVERRAYRHAFHEGMLGPEASAILERELDLHLDRLKAGELEPPASRTPDPGGLRALLGRAMNAIGLRRGLEFDRLALRYDLSRAEQRAAADVRRAMKRLSELDPQTVAAIDEAYARYEYAAKERIEDLRVNLPEIAGAIETRLAERIALNFELHGYETLLHHGEIGAQAAEKALDDVEARLKRLHFAATRVELAETAELCREMPLFRDLEESTVQQLAELTEELPFARGEHLFQEGDRGDGMFIISRGSVHVVKGEGEDEQLLGVLTGGEILGEMSLLTGEGRSASARCATSVTVGKIKRTDFQRLMEGHPEVRDRIWATFARYKLTNVLEKMEDLSLPPEERERWLATGRTVELSGEERLEAGEASWALVLTGRLGAGSPPLFRCTSGASHVAQCDTRVLLLGEAPMVVRETLTPEPPPE